MFFSSLIALSTVSFVVSLPAGVYVGDKGEVGASWGGFAASAGLGGFVGGSGAKGGLHAEAGTPGGQFAAAGLGGGVGDYGVAGGSAVASAGAGASSSAGSVQTGTKPVHTKGTFFDDIFNIPQSVLRSVNEYLNRRAGVVQVKSKHHIHSAHPSVVSATAIATAEGGAVGLKSEISGGASSNQINPGTPTRTKYDDIFAIPQSALSAVANFLNRG